MNVVLSIIHCQCTQFSYGVKVKKELTRRNPKMISILNQRKYFFLVVISHQTSSKDA